MMSIIRFKSLTFLLFCQFLLFFYFKRLLKTFSLFEVRLSILLDSIDIIFESDKFEYKIKLFETKTRYCVIDLLKFEFCEIISTSDDKLTN